MEKLTRTKEQVSADYLTESAKMGDFVFKANFAQKMAQACMAQLDALNLELEALENQVEDSVASS